MKIYVFDIDDTLVIHKNNTVDYDSMKPNDFLLTCMEVLDSPKYIYTNGTYGHAEEVINRIGFNNHIKKTFARDTIPFMKPDIFSLKHVEYEIMKDTNSYKNEYVFFDDTKENLKTAKMYGWTTIWIHPNFTEKESYMDYSYPNIYQALLIICLKK
jgi:putative hydrolase of the HAD superfamily